MWGQHTCLALSVNVTHIHTHTHNPPSSCYPKVYHFSPHTRTHTHTHYYPLVIICGHQRGRERSHNSTRHIHTPQICTRYTEQRISPTGSSPLKIPSNFGCFMRLLWKGQIEFRLCDAWKLRRCWFRIGCNDTAVFCLSTISLCSHCAFDSRSSALMFALCWFSCLV